MKPDSESIYVIKAYRGRKILSSHNSISEAHEAIEGLGWTTNSDGSRFYKAILHRADSRELNAAEIKEFNELSRHSNAFEKWRTKTLKIYSPILVEGKWTVGKFGKPLTKKEIKDICERLP